MIKHIFFDLDHTLWDFDRNSHETLSELYHELELESKLQTEAEAFIRKYKEINENQWALYRQGEISKEILRTSRYSRTFKHFGYENEVEAAKFGDLYVERSPIKTHLCDGCIDLLQQLNNRYELHIITNGFEEIQPIKMKSSGIDQYFKVLMTSERANCKKPGTDIFLKAMAEARTNAKESIMLGDSYEADVIGAENVGMKAVLFDANGKYPEVAHRKISHLSQFLDHL